MQDQIIIAQRPQAIPPTGKPSPPQQLEAARKNVQTALRAATDETPSFALLDDIARSLTQAMRDLDGLRVTVAVLSRKETRG